MSANVEIGIAGDPADLSAVRALFEEYAAWLEVDLCFQGFSDELASLPGKYAPPDGRLYLATIDAQPAGCIALKRLDEKTAEVKRLYVRPDFRGRGLGLSLARRVIEDARSIGYRSLVLDTLERMSSARKIYKALGFRRITPYYVNPLEGVVYMRLDLSGYLNAGRRGRGKS